MRVIGRNDLLKLPSEVPSLLVYEPRRSAQRARATREHFSLPSAQAPRRGDRIGVTQPAIPCWKQLRYCLPASGGGAHQSRPREPNRAGSRVRDLSRSVTQNTTGRLPGNP